MTDFFDNVEIALEQVISDMGGQSRPGQVKMANQVAQCLQMGGKLMVEAGTGTGKSLGYLIPALLWAVERDAPALVSTATIALQNQILHKDAPLAVAALEKIGYRSARVVLLKGWQNYVCAQKIGASQTGNGSDLIDLSYEKERESAGFKRRGSFAGESYSEQVQRAFSFAFDTETGDRDDLKPGVSDRAWAQVSIPKNLCSGIKCPLADKCFPMAARKELVDADLVVTNHALLGVAAAGNPNVIPEHSSLIIDEAHDLSARVRSQSTVEISESSLRSLSRSLGVAKLSGGERLSDSTALFAAALEHLPEGRIKNGIPEDLAAALVGLQTDLRAVAVEVKERLEGDDGADVNPSSPLFTAQVATRQALEVVSVLLSPAVSNASQVVWCTTGRDAPVPPRLYTAPLDVASLLAENLFAEKTVIMTSATLKLGGSFDSMAADTGFTLSAEPVTQIDVGTPFALRKQGILYLSADTPPPDRGQIAEATFTRMLDLVTASDGGMLGLFSSWKTVNAAAAVLRENTDYPVYVQGEDQIGELVEAYKSDPQSCLLGVNTLWQGVDVPGLTNRLVVMASIPFPVPTDPIIDALNEQAVAQGDNSFITVSIPRAALLMAQGAGRLLRSADDYGVVAILDSRIVSKGYGAFLVNSLPDMWRTTDNEKVTAALQRLREKI